MSAWTYPLSFYSGLAALPWHIWWWRSLPGQGTVIPWKKYGKIAAKRILFTIFHPKTCSILSPTGIVRASKPGDCGKAPGSNTPIVGWRCPDLELMDSASMCITSSTPKKNINFTLKVSARVASLVHWRAVCCSTKQFVVSLLIGGSRPKHTVQDKTKYRARNENRRLVIPWPWATTDP